MEKLNHVGGRPSKQEFEVAPERRLTRGHVARMLGVHVSAVRRLEARGDLHPEVGPGGIRYFTVYELRDLQARRLSVTRGRSAAMRLAAFELFREGVDWRDVAIQLRYDPYRVHRLWQLYVVDENSGD
jgi:hypothetical protein